MVCGGALTAKKSDKQLLVQSQLQERKLGKEESLGSFCVSAPPPPPPPPAGPARSWCQITADQTQIA